MNTFIILAVLIAWIGLVDGVMDKVKFHYYDSILSIRNPESKFALWWEKWSDPMSWKNQYVDWDGGDYRKRIIASGPLIWLCDFWHFVKTILVMSQAFLVVYALASEYRPGLWESVGILLGYWFLRGVVHDLTMEALDRKTYE